MLEKTGFKLYFSKIMKVLFFILVLLSMYMPVFIIIYQSFNKTANAMTPLAWGGFTFKNYGEIFTNNQLYISILDSLLVSFWATAIATFVGVFASIGINSLSGKRRKVMNFLNEIPMMNSEIVTGISIMIIFSLLSPLFPKAFGFPSMLVAHVFFTIPYVILMVLPKLEQTDEAIFEAAQDLGCNKYKALFKVIIPSLKTPILAGALIAFTLSIDDFVISFYTQGNGFSNFSNYVYTSYAKKNFSAGAYAFNALLTFVTLLIVFIISLKTTRKVKKVTK
jgi:spermidine/putrescine transport system permease protein